MSEWMIHRLVLGWGKIRRAVLVYLINDIAKRKLANRQGECHGCGACCELMFVCSWLDRTNGNALCRCYDSRSKVCELFPLDERDLKDRDRANPKQKCGYWFDHRI